MELVGKLCAPTEDEEVLRLLCGSACRELDGLLADGVTAEDCGERYCLAAAWLVMDWLAVRRDWEGVTSLSAGSMTVRREKGTGGLLRDSAMELMKPYMKDRGFDFRGVRG